MLYSGCARAFGGFSWSGSEELSVLDLFLCVLGQVLVEGFAVPCKGPDFRILSPFEGAKLCTHPYHSKGICQGDFHSGAFQRCKTFLSAKRK